MSIKKKVNLFDDSTIDVINDWSMMKNKKVKDISKSLRTTLEYLKKADNSIILGKINGLNPLEVPLTLKRDNNNLMISFSCDHTTAYVNIWENQFPKYNSTFKDIIWTSGSNTFFTNRKIKALGFIDNKYSFFYTLLQHYTIALEKDGYLLTDVSVSNDAGYITSDKRQYDTRIGFLMYHKEQNKMVSIDFEYEHQTTVVADKDDRRKNM